MWSAECSTYRGGRLQVPLTEGDTSAASGRGIVGLIDRGVDGSAGILRVAVPLLSPGIARCPAPRTSTPSPSFVWSIERCPHVTHTHTPRPTPTLAHTTSALYSVNLAAHSRRQPPKETRARDAPFERSPERWEEHPTCTAGMDRAETNRAREKKNVPSGRGGYGLSIRRVNSV